MKQENGVPTNVNSGNITNDITSNDQDQNSMKRVIGDLISRPGEMNSMEPDTIAVEEQDSSTGEPKVGPSEPSNSLYNPSGSVLMGLLTRKNDAPFVYPKLIGGDEPESVPRSRSYTCPTSKDMRTRPELKVSEEDKVDYEFRYNLVLLFSFWPTTARTNG